MSRGGTIPVCRFLNRDREVACAPVFRLAQGNNELLAALNSASPAGTAIGTSAHWSTSWCGPATTSPSPTQPASYIDAIDTTDWQTPDGSRPSEWIRVVRPEIERKTGVESTDFAPRVAVEAPAGSDAVLGDVTIGGNKIAFGGQIADKVSVRPRGIAREAPSQAPTLSCLGKEGLVAAMTDEVAPGPVLPSRRVVAPPE
jgi:hypothetical protein